MKEKNKDIRVLKGTLIYCEDVKSALNRCSRNFEVFSHDRVFFHAISMSCMQVGELANSFSEGFKERNSGAVDWRQLRSIRNIFAQRIVILINGLFGNLQQSFFPFTKNFVDKN